MSTTYDVVVLGGGPGGYGVALRATVRGLSVAMIEADKVGGTCLHWGCIPSKAMLHVGGVLDETRHAADFGLDLSINGIDVAKLGAFREKVQNQLWKGLDGLVKGRGIELVEGYGSVNPDGRSVTVDGRTISGDNLVLAVGSKVRSLPGIEIDGDVVITSDEATKLRRIPKKALVIGSGAVGLEFASLFKSLGAEEVVVVEALDRIAPLEDAEVSKSLARAYRKRKITTVAGTVASSVTVVDGPDGKAATVSLANGDAHVVDTVLVAVGRAPRTEDIGLEGLGVLDERGYVPTDEWCRTPVDGLWAVGDILPPPALALAHAGFAEGFLVADQIAAAKGITDADGEAIRVEPIDYALVPRVTYCAPEVASVGLTQAQAEEQHGKDAIKVSQYTFKGNAKGIIHGPERGGDGFVKVVTGGPEGAVLGVHVVGPHATDLIAEAQLITAWGALPAEVGALVHPHPTLAEAMGEAHMAAAGLPFHTH